jgi:hypothetical protein
LVFITEMKSVYSAVRTGYLNKAGCASSVKERRRYREIFVAYGEFNTILGERIRQTCSRVF